MGRLDSLAQPNTRHYLGREEEGDYTSKDNDVHGSEGRWENRLAEATEMTSNLNNIDPLYTCMSSECPERGVPYGFYPNNSKEKLVRCGNDECPVFGVWVDKSEVLENFNV